MSELTNFDNQFIENLQKRAIEEHERFKKHFGSSVKEANNFKFPIMAMRIPEDFKCGESFYATLLYIAGDLINLVSFPLLHAFKRTESPIEKYMLLALTAIACRKADKVSLIVDEDRTIYGFQSKTYETEITIEPQAKVGQYRVDFLVTTIEPFIHPKEEKIKKQLIVECDGHEFHEKTKEQVIMDKKRDRELQKEGFNVFRFTGSEIWQDAFECAETSMSFMIDKAREEYFIKHDIKWKD